MVQLMGASQFPRSGMVMMPPRTCRLFSAAVTPVLRMAFFA